jgi:tetratricopeptide (TPR) repeat protein
MSMHVVRELWEAVEKGEVPARVLVETAKSHFLSLCPVCEAEFEAFRRGQGKTAPPPCIEAAGAVLEEHLKRIRGQEQGARKALTDLLALPWELRFERIGRSRSRFRGAALVHLLLDEYWQTVRHDPQEAFRLAELAGAVAREPYPTERPVELIVLTLACMGNAMRVQGDLRDAAKWFAHVRHLLNTADVRAVEVMAKIDWMEGAFRKDQRRFQQAAQLLSRAAVLYRLAGSATDMAGVLMTLADVHSYRGRPIQAVKKVREALLLLDRRSEPKLFLWGQHNLAQYLAETGKYEEAARIIARSSRLYEEYATPTNLVRRTWLEGRIAAGLGDEAGAEAAFRSACEAFLERSLSYDAALVALDLALLYLGQNRTREVCELAEAIVPAFEARDIHREALASLVLFREAARCEAVTPPLIRRLTRYLLKAKANPSVPPFEPAF